MEQYIKKSAIVAKIKRRFDECSSSILKHYDACKEAKALELGKILTIIDTLEVIEIGVDLGDPKGDKSAKYIIDTKNLELKDVDLHKEIKDYFDNQPIVTKSGGVDYQLIPSAETIAKHFFELGLNASNPIAKENLESFVRRVIDLDIEAGEYYNNIIEEERKESSGSDLMINLLCGAIDAKELGIQYVLNKLKAQIL